MTKLTHITGTFEFSDGSTHSFLINLPANEGEGMWSQWGDTAQHLGERETGDLLATFLEAAKEFVADREDPPAEVPAHRLTAQRGILVESHRVANQVGTGTAGYQFRIDTAFGRITYWTAPQCAAAYKGMPGPGTPMTLIFRDNQLINYGWDEAPVQGPGEDL